MHLRSNRMFARDSIFTRDGITNSPFALLIKETRKKVEGSLDLFCLQIITCVIELQIR